MRLGKLDGGSSRINYFEIINIRKKYRKAEANICPVNLTTNVQDVWVEHGEVGSEISVLKTREE